MYVYLSPPSSIVHFVYGIQLFTDTKGYHYNYLADSKGFSCTPTGSVLIIKLCCTYSADGCIANFEGYMYT